MNKLDLELQGQCSFPITYFGKSYGKKELKGNDYLMLFGALALICDNNEDLLSEYGLDMQTIIKDSAICSDELCLNNFEGYDISDRLNLNSLYLNEHGCVMASVLDRKKDRYLEFVC